MKLTALGIALAAAAVVGGYWAIQYGGPENGRRSAQPVEAQAPVPFQSEPTLIAGATPGDDVRRYVENVGTPGALFDAFMLIDACVKAERHSLPDREARCAGISDEHRRKAGEMLTVAMMAGVPGAAVEFTHVLYLVPNEELTKERRENPRMEVAVRTVVEKLEEAAQREREAIRLLARLYRYGNPVTGERNAEKALTYVTAEHALRPSLPSSEKLDQMSIAQLTADLTPEQVKRAREAGLQLARSCDCRDG